MVAVRVKPPFGVGVESCFLPGFSYVRHLPRPLHSPAALGFVNVGRAMSIVCGFVRLLTIPARTWQSSCYRSRCTETAKHAAPENKHFLLPPA